jgi:hypothetical protein
MVLSIAYAATIGGLATLIGSPPTLVMAGYVQDAFGVSLGFANWMALGVPISATFLVIAWVFLTRFAFPTDLPELEDGKRVIREQLDALGRTTTGEWLVLVVFLTTAALWVGHGPLSDIEAVANAAPFIVYLSDEAIAVGAAILLLAVPVPGRGGQPRGGPGRRRRTREAGRAASGRRAGPAGEGRAGRPSGAPRCPGREHRPGRRPRGRRDPGQARQAPARGSGGEARRDLAARPAVR